MKSRAFAALLLCLIAVDFSTAGDDQTANVTETLHSDDHNKLLLECQHPDYRTYIKCLKRHKRHHSSHGDHDGDGGDFKHKCFDECGMDQCETTKCVHDCHKRCMKKTKETRQIITQYETTCESAECKEDKKSVDLPTTNITTNIDINNVINNHMPKPGGNGNSPGGGGGSGSNGGSGDHRPPSSPSGPCTGNNPCCGGTPCSGGGGWYGASAGLTLVPQIQFVPQLTFGLGAGGFAGGGLWHQGQIGGVDCSGCSNPFLRYRCDVSCYATQGNQNTGPISNVNPAGCQTPHCVGGT